MTIDRTAAEGFQAGAGAYERARPDYPPDAVAWLCAALRIEVGTRVVDLGAGTGKLTALLFPTGAALVAVEPVEAMRLRLAASLSSVAVVAGIAERLPLGPATADAVVAAQAFHWFDGPVALREIHRVLSPGGRLGLLWNARDTSVPWIAALAGIVDAYGDAIQRHESGAWRASFDETTLFGSLVAAEFLHAQTVDEPALLDRVASTSFIATLPERERASVLARVTDLVRTHPDLRGRDTFEFRYRTRVFWSERLGD